MRPEPGDGVQRRLLALVDAPVDRREIRVLEQLPAIPAKSFDVLIIRLLKTPLQTPVHRPISRQSRLLIVDVVVGRGGVFAPAAALQPLLHTESFAHASLMLMLMMSVLMLLLLLGR